VHEPGSWSGAPAPMMCHSPTTTLGGDLTGATSVTFNGTPAEFVVLGGSALFWWLPAWVMLGYWFVVQFLMGAATSIAETSDTGGVAVWAHVGGFVTGILLIKLLPERRGRYRYASW
jgi:membrane associated rhomboid family serine protease